MLVYNAYVKVRMDKDQNLQQLIKFIIFSYWAVSKLGVRVEYGPNQESNNTLITVNGIQKDNAALVLFCSTDRENCCIDEFNIPGSWFLPNGTKISTNYTQSLHNIALGSQTVGMNISPDLPSGIYHCEMMDRRNITHHLYAGIYPENEGISISIKLVM